MNQNLTIIAIILIKSRNVANQSRGKSRKVAEGRTKSRNVACNCGDVQVEDRPTGSWSGAYELLDLCMPKIHKATSDRLYQQGAAPRVNTAQV
jgi:hypothetical protein